MNVLLLYLLLTKATLTSFSGLTSLPIVRHDLVEHYQVLTDRQLNAAVAAGRTAPGPNGLYLVSVGYFVAARRADAPHCWRPSRPRS
jgi:chromate transporter